MYSQKTKRPVKEKEQGNRYNPVLRDSLHEHSPMPIQTFSGCNWHQKKKNIRNTLLSTLNKIKQYQEGCKEKKKGRKETNPCY